MADDNKFSFYNEANKAKGNGRGLPRFSLYRVFRYSHARLCKRYLTDKKALGGRFWRTVGGHFIAGSSTL